ncbi:MAG: hypothetical protein LBC85_06425, partial [Fibromonadaceae bacterium]|nr:hypothetical protein [Fibromonadaceae bacterium]
KSDFDAPGLSAANELLEYSRLSREDKLRYDWYVDKWRSNVSSINTARDEGKAEGKAEGELEGEARVLELMAKGHTLEQIKDILKLQKNSDSPLLTEM